MEWDAALAGFVGGLVVLLVSKTLERKLLRGLDEAEASRDVVIQLASALQQFESFLDPLATATPPSSREKLVDMHSGYDLPALPLALDKLLPQFGSPEVHRLLVLLYGSVDFFARRAADHRAAYYWLLDDQTGNWQSPSHKERVRNLEVCRTSMLEEVKDILQYGYEIVERVLAGTESFGATVLRGHAGQYLGFLQRTYGIDKQTARMRRAFYATRPSLSIGHAKDHEFVIWRDHLDEIAGGPNAILCGTIEGEHGPRMIPAGVEVALPRALVLSDINVRRPAKAWEHIPGSIQQTFSRSGPRLGAQALTLSDEIRGRLARPGQPNQ